MTCSAFVEDIYNFWTVASLTPIDLISLTIFWTIIVSIFFVINFDLPKFK